jgi:hypothetical protein
MRVLLIFMEIRMFYLKRNLPFVERGLCLPGAIMLALVVSAWLSAGWLAWILWVSGAALAGTAIAGFCPACALAGRRFEGGTE